ncbi:acetylglutamate kinase [Candidatus Sumerlaeota bacterium]|nr:acetylglutamate kinase [Candidatus Sumerlaeota bacterium]
MDTPSNTNNTDLRQLSLDALIEKASTLTEALPFIRKFAGTTVVVKYGGAAMVDPELKKLVIQDLALLWMVGIRVVIVHGGGPEINNLLKKMNLETKFVDGHRVTDQATLDVAEMVLAGRVNGDLTYDLNRAGIKAVGLSGKDANLLLAHKHLLTSATTGALMDIGFVGEIVKVDTSTIDVFLKNEIMPVICPIGVDENGQTYNINADTAAACIAAAIRADKFILLTDVEGVMRDKNDKSSLIEVMDSKEAKALIKDGIIAGGMIPKVEACLDTMDKGVKETHILDGRLPHSLLLEVFTNRGIGTLIKK